MAFRGVTGVPACADTVRDRDSQPGNLLARQPILGQRLMSESLGDLSVLSMCVVLSFRLGIIMGN